MNTMFLCTWDRKTLSATKSKCNSPNSLNYNQSMAREFQWLFQFSVSALYKKVHKCACTIFYRLPHSAKVKGLISEKCCAVDNVKTTGSLWHTPEYSRLVIPVLKCLWAWRWTPKCSRWAGQLGWQLFVLCPQAKSSIYCKCSPFNFMSRPCTGLQHYS